jgi:hypothetical protein
MDHPKPQTGSGCLTLFALPFCGAGLFSLFQAYKQFAEGPADWEKTTMLAIAGLVFSGAGFGMIGASRYGLAKAHETEQLKQTYPDSPWMWRAEWTTGRVPGSDRSTMLLAWAFAAFWNLISAPILFIFPEEFFDKGNKFALIGLLFPAVGAGLLVWAVRATLRWRKFGSSTFEMTTLPGVIGGPLRGTIHTALRRPPETGVQVQLNCIRRVVTRGRNGSTNETILWQEDYVAGAERLYAGERGITIPVEFRVPYDSLETSSEDSDNQILWRLQVAAAVAGIDYGTQFEVPVFKTAQSSAEPQPSSSFSILRNDPANAFDPANATIRVRPSALGGTEYYFGPARNLGAAIAMLFFTAIWAGAIWLMLHVGAPVFFPIIFGLLLLLFVLILADLLFQTTRVTVESGTVKIRNSTLGMGSAKEIPCAEVTEVKLGSSMQQQPTATQSGRMYYDLEIHRKYGKRVKAGNHIRNKREAEWLAAEMRRQIEAHQS